MQTVVKKWGNSLALRLPQGIKGDQQILVARARGDCRGAVLRA